MKAEGSRKSITDREAKTSLKAATSMCRLRISVNPDLAEAIAGGNRALDQESDTKRILWMRVLLGKAMERVGQKQRSSNRQTTDPP
jgi:hypothetical protein